MKNDKIKNNNIPQETATDEKVITRKQALQKAGLVTLSTASMLLLLKSPAKAAASAPTPPPAW
ncbi:hypothetical protein MASR2M47_45930 [Draconibacterium sp.]